MCPGRVQARGPSAGKRVALSTICGLGMLVSACAHGPQRVLPENAVQPPGASFEGYPEIGRTQKAKILEEIACSSAAQFVMSPLRTSVQFVGRTGERLAVRAREIVPFEIPHGPSDAELAINEACIDLGGGAGGPPTPAYLRLLPDSEPAIEALLLLIASAQCRIDLMMYGWENDATGWEVANALAQRAQTGVQVRLLVDRAAFLIHNASAARNECTFLDFLKSVPNVTVIEPPNPLLRFDHRKLAVIDDRIAWTGGMILTEVARRRWHNFAFLAEGPIVAQYARVFETRWQSVGGAPLACRCNGSPAAITPNATVRLVQTDDGTRSLKSAVYHAVDHARHFIYLENPYFSDEILARKLVAASKRGVQVHAVLTLRGNMKQLNRFETLTANWLFRGGAHVYLYPAMTHVKAMSVDGVWAYIGTGNFDELSLRNNHEVGLSVSSPELVQSLDRCLFLPDIAASQALTDLLPRPKNPLELEALSVWY